MICQWTWSTYFKIRILIALPGFACLGYKHAIHKIQGKYLNLFKIHLHSIQSSGRSGLSVCEFIKVTTLSERSNFDAECSWVWVKNIWVEQTLQNTYEQILNLRLCVFLFVKTISKQFIIKDRDFVGHDDALKGSIEGKLWHIKFLKTSSKLK